MTTLSSSSAHTILDGTVNTVTLDDDMVEWMDTVYVDLTKDPDVVASLGDVKRLERELRNERSIFTDPSRHKVAIPSSTHNPPSLSSTSKHYGNPKSLKAADEGKKQRVVVFNTSTTVHSRRRRNVTTTVDSSILDFELPSGRRRDDVVSRMRNCNFKPIKCTSDDDCTKSCGTSNFKCIHPPDHRDGEKKQQDGGVCSRKIANKEVEPYVPCSSIFGTNVATVVDGIVRWTCKSKFPGLVNNYGMNVSCRQGMFVHESTMAPYIPGFHDPTACICTNCPAGFISTRTSCAKDSCYPGVRNWRENVTTEAIYGKTAPNVSVNWKKYEEDAFGENTCLCPRGYVSCPGPAFELSEVSFVCPMALEHHTPVCVPDPCNRGINEDNVSFYNHARRRCMQAINPYPELEQIFGPDHCAQYGARTLDETEIRKFNKSLTPMRFQEPNPTKADPLERRGLKSKGPWVIAFTEEGLGPSRGFLTKLYGCLGYNALVPKRAPPISTQDWWGVWQPHMQPALKYIIDQHTTPEERKAEEILKQAREHASADVQMKCIL